MKNYIKKATFNRERALSKTVVNTCTVYLCVLAIKMIEIVLYIGLHVAKRLLLIALFNAVVFKRIDLYHAMLKQKILPV